MTLILESFPAVNPDAELPPATVPLALQCPHVPAGNRFAFPELPASASERTELGGADTDPQAGCGAGISPATDSRGGGATTGVVAWPECGCEETVRACARLAESVRARLASGASAVLAFTAAADDDDKTSLVVALAPQLAQRTPGGLLVADADPHRATLTRRLALGESGPEVSLPSVWPTTVPGLNVVAVSEITRAQIDPVAPNWPVVLLDAVSLEHDEAEATLCRCDGLYLVVRVGRTGRHAIRRAAETIAAWGLELLGCVAMMPESEIEPSR